MMTFLLQAVLSFAGVIGFSILFNVPKKELAFCGITGATGWLVLQFVGTIAPYATVAATLFGAITVTVASRIFSIFRKTPVTIYMIPGIIPMVPGIGIYYTMFNAVMGDNSEALLWGIETLRTAGVIAVGLLIILTMPRKLFTFGMKV